jgi:hypothetical protein
MALAITTVPFFVDLKGESTGQTFQGDFACKPRLSSRDRLQKDALRRTLLGGAPESASPDALVRAEMFALISISLTDSPPWWKESGNGLDLFDDNVVFDVYDKVTDIQDSAVKETIAAGEKAVEGLREEGKKKSKQEE